MTLKIDWEGQEHAVVVPENLSAGMTMRLSRVVVLVLAHVHLAGARLRVLTKPVGEPPDPLTW